MKDGRKLIDLARALKPRDFTGRCWHVTFAFNKSRLLAVGWNKPNHTHPRNLRLDYIKNGRHLGTTIGLHSELACFLRLGREDCSSIDFYNVRIDRNGNPNMSFPCRGCLSLFHQIGARQVFATDKNGDFTRIMNLAPGDKI